MKIKKLGYSRSPWRLIDEDGRELDYICQVHGYTLPVCAQTKDALVQKALAMLESTTSELASAKKLISLYEAGVIGQKYNTAA